MSVLFKHEKYFNERISLNLSFKIRVNGRETFENVIAYVDTGFSLGVRLPEKFLELDIPGLQDTQEDVSIEHQGERVGRFRLYSLLFNIIDGSGHVHPVSSSKVIFKGKDYALLGMDFFREFGGELAVHGSQGKFCFYF